MVSAREELATTAISLRDPNWSNQSGPTNFQHGIRPAACISHQIAAAPVEISARTWKNAARTPDPHLG
jgi:hypothetical protein